MEQLYSRKYPRSGGSIGGFAGHVEPGATKLFHAGQQNMALQSLVHFITWNNFIPDRQ
jgi:hypothetical protein